MAAEPGTGAMVSRSADGEIVVPDSGLVGACADSGQQRPGSQRRRDGASVSDQACAQGARCHAGGRWTAGTPRIGSEGDWIARRENQRSSPDGSCGPLETLDLPQDLGSVSTPTTFLQNRSLPE